MNVFRDFVYRDDGRRPNELRQIRCKLGANEADGSSYMEHGLSKVLVSVHGPHPVTSENDEVSSDRAVIKCKLQIAPLAVEERCETTPSNRLVLEKSIIIRRALEAAIVAEEYPGSQIDIFILVLYSDGTICSTCINAGTLALIHAGIELKDYVCACSAGLLNDVPVVDINYFEERIGGTELVLAILVHSEAIVCDELTGLIHRDTLDELRRIAIQGCKDVYAILEEAVRRHSALNQIS